MRWRYVLWPLALFLAILVGGLGFVVSTQTGLSGLLAVAEKVLPGTLTYERIEGRLIGPLHLENLRYTQDELDLGLRQARLDWHPRELLRGGLHVGVLETDGLTLHLPQGEETPPEESEPLNLSDISLPVHLEIDAAQMTDTRIWPYGAEEPLVVDSALLQGRTSGRGIDLETLAISALQGRLNASGQAQLSGDIPIELTLRGTFDHPDHAPLQLDGTVTGALDKTLSVKLATSGLAELVLAGEVSRVLTDPGWSATMTLVKLDLEQFSAELADSELSGALETQGRPDEFKLKGELQTTLPEFGLVTTKLDAEGSPEAIQLKNLTASSSASSLAFSAKANIDLAGQTVDGQGQWQSLAWPMTGEPRVESREGRFTLTGTLQDYTFSLAADLAGPELGALQARIEAAGSDREIRVAELSVQALAGETGLKASGTLSFADLAFKADGQWKSLAWPLTGQAQVASPQGSFSAHGTPRDYELTLEADLSSEQSGPLKAIVRAAGTDQAVRIPELSLRARNGDLTLNAQGEVRFADLSFEADGKWRSLAWPLVGTPQVQSSQGTFQASGNLDDYRFQLDTELEGPAIPKGDWSLDGKGSTRALERLRLKSRILEGQIEADIKAAWQPAVSWDGQLTAAGLNPGAQWPDLPGKLGLKLRSRGSLANDTLEATLNIDDLSGRLREQTVKGNGQVTVDGETFTVTALQLSAGEARLDASGSLNQSWDIRWQLETPDLGRLLPGAGGTISASGEIKGARDTPQASLAVALADLAYAETRIRRLQANGTVDVSGATRSSLEVNGQNLLLAGQSWSTVRLEGSGTPDDHQLQGALAGDPSQFEMALSGSLDQQAATWRGRLTQLAARGVAFGDWSLGNPLPLEISATQASAEQACLVSAPTRICAQGSWDADTGAEGRLSIDNLDFQRFASLLPDTVYIDTGLSGEATFSRRPDGTLLGDAVARLRPGNLTVKAQGAHLDIGLSGELRASSDGKDASAELGLDLGTLGRVRADAKLTDVLGRREVDGKLQANVDDLGFVSAFVPQVENVTGRIDVDMGLSGTLPALVVGGRLQHANGAVDIPAFDTKIRGVALKAESDRQGALLLSGSATSGPGNLKLSGKLTPAEGQLDLKIQGNNFQVANAPDLQALVSPDLSIALKPGEVRVKGEILIPEAFVSPGSSGSSGSRVSASPDVIIVNPSDEEGEPILARGLGIYAQVRVVLGDKVRVEAFDFAGNVRGNLLVVESPQLGPRATGSVEVETGDYVISGQRLNIERGRVLFSNSPLDNPVLDLRVTRTIEQAAPIQGSRAWGEGANSIESLTATSGNQNIITVGAQVTGTLKRPDLALFSTPPMPDSSILSYLALGQAPGAAESASVVLGTYLSPRLYVGYGVAISPDAPNSFMVRYRINNRFDFRATSSGDASGADILYTIELR